MTALLRPRNVIAGVGAMLILGAFLWVLLPVLSADLAALLGSLLIWSAGLAWLAFALIGDPDCPYGKDPSISKDEETLRIALFMLERYVAVAYSCLSLPSFWIGLAAAHWFLIFACYL